MNASARTPVTAANAGASATVASTTVNAVSAATIPATTASWPRGETVWKSPSTP